MILDERTGFALQARDERDNVILSVAKNPVQGERRDRKFFFWHDRAEAANAVGVHPVKFFAIVMLLASSAFAWPWSSDKKNAENEARIKDSLLQVEVRNLQREVETLTRIRMQKADSL